MAEYQTFAFDSATADLIIDKFGNLEMASGDEALSFITLNAVRTVRGELVYNSNYGVPYFSTIFASPPNLRMWEFYVKDTALSVDGIIGVSSFVYENVAGTVSYEMVLETDKGKVTVNG